MKTILTSLSAALAAVLAGAQTMLHVAPNGVDDTAVHNGLSWDEPFLTLQYAVDALGPGGGEIVLSNGTYDVSSPVTWGIGIMLTAPVTVRGVTGNPEDVTVRRNPSEEWVRVFHLDHPGARVESVTVRDGRVITHPDAANVYIGAAGGTVSNCVITTGRSYIYWHGDYSGGVYMGGELALVTHCVITNNTFTEGGNFNNQGGGVRMVAGRLEHSLIAYNTAATTTLSGLTAAGGVSMAGGSIVNCTIAGNRGSNYGGIYISGGTVTNTVIAGNVSTLSGGNDAAWGVNIPDNTNLFVNCFTDSPDAVNTGCPNYPGGVNLLLANVAGGDFYPAPLSPLIGAGLPLGNLPAKDLLGNDRMRPDGSLDVGCLQADLTKFAVSFDCVPPSGFTPVQAVFTAMASGVEPGHVVEYHWDFTGNGETDRVTTTPVVTNEYAVGGYFYASLLATNTTVGGPAVTAVAGAPLHYVPRVLHVVSTNAANAELPYHLEANAAATIQAAVDFALPGCEIVIHPGDYPVWAVGDTTPPGPSNAGVLVNKALRLRGATGNPADVVIRGTGQDFSVLRLNHASAWVEGVTLQDGYKIGNGANLWIEALGGTVTNCVIRNGRKREYWNDGAAMYLNSANALVTHCVITNNNVSFTQASDGKINSILLMGNGRVENSLIANNGYTAACVRWMCVSMGVCVDDAWNVLPDRHAINNMGVCVVTLNGGMVRNCTFADNTATLAETFPNGDTTVAGAVLVFGNGIVTNCVVAGNGPGPLCNNPARVFTSTTDDPALLANGNNFADADAIFKNFAGGNHRLKPGSPAVNAGPRVTPQDVATAGVDLDGFPRIYGWRMDNGCYELQHTAGTLFIIR